jgi:hypothetical protein
MTILPLTYLGGVEWFAHLAGGDCIVDVGENWVKQTARNRAEILTAGGVAALTVPVHGGNAHGGNSGAQIRIRDVRIDNSKRWQHTHWVSMVSAYRNSPFFDHYEERFAPVYGAAKRFDFLVDLNLELLDIVTAALRLGGGTEGSGRSFRLSEGYVAASPGDLDLRGKKSLRRPGANPNPNPPPNPSPGSGPTASGPPPQNFYFREYIQVFADRMPFIPGLSIVDLLFCEGPSARELLRSGKSRQAREPLRPTGRQ